MVCPELGSVSIPLLLHLLYVIRIDALIMYFADRLLMTPYIRRMKPFRQHHCKYLPSSTILLILTKKFDCAQDGDQTCL